MGAKRAKTGAAFPRRRRVSGIINGTRLVVADNSGAKEVVVVGSMDIKTRLRRIPFATVGDMVVVTVKKGPPDMRGQIMRAIIVRQKKPFRRPDGTWVAFEDNACVLVTPEGMPKGKEVRGPVAREAAERWSQIAGLVSIVV
ncbi:MAG: 50S ribosomal protein L14 [Ignisphaera sp.]|nr:50S ribosomal protein L14 [Ignisphaera sp.]MCX8168490.1 50S ribosomal protein L14 [Ignisphaera sp.]MDW8085070.1 50S ribosomal protein L14 [Ignisphaera sp.]